MALGLESRALEALRPSPLGPDVRVPAIVLTTADESIRRILWFPVSATKILPESLTATPDGLAKLAAEASPRSPREPRPCAERVGSGSQACTIAGASRLGSLDRLQESQ